MESDDDVLMSDAEPLYPGAPHSRLPSNVSSASSDTSDSSTNSRVYSSSMLCLLQIKYREISGLPYIRHLSIAIFHQ